MLSKLWIALRYVRMYIYIYIYRLALQKTGCRDTDYFRIVLWESHAAVTEQPHTGVITIRQGAALHVEPNIGPLY